MLTQPSKYQTKTYTFTPALERARRPLRVRNAVTGIFLLGFVGAVYSYSMFAIKQDDFSDVPMPPDLTVDRLTNY
ncbi:13532_t:CDS:2 [Ambispora gerdemannii]|uniref:Cytochrome c oxidase assembly factor 3 n=1 Tax=Ambispora gerdemannii TaxID=144530 RepID=A0A9N8VBT9_9GLOM|nr:13532_t:CDS:2 [Ambispora gerdemannii]